MSAKRTMAALWDAQKDIDRAMREVRPTVGLVKPSHRWFIAKHVAVGTVIGLGLVAGFAWWLKKNKKGYWTPTTTAVSGLDVLGVDSEDEITGLA